MKNDNILIYVTYWNNGVKDAFIPLASLPERDRNAVSLFMEEPWCDECMCEIGYLEDDICSYIPEESGNEDFSWNPFHHEKHRNILEIIFILNNNKEVFYSFLNFTLGGSVLGSEEFMFKHRIPKSRFESYLILRHTDHNTTLMDIINNVNPVIDRPAGKSCNRVAWTPSDDLKNKNEALKRCKEACLILSEGLESGSLSLDDFVSSVNFVYNLTEGDNSDNECY